MSSISILFMISVISTLIASASLLWGFCLKRRFDQREASQTEAQRQSEIFSEQEIRRLTDERDVLLDALDDAFLLIDSDGNVSFANTAARGLFGTRHLAGRPASEILLDPRLFAPVQQSRASDERITSRVVFSQQTSPRGDLENRGDNAWIIDAAPLPRRQGQQATSRVLIRDVTAEYQTDQVRKDFVANASHELRTPMAIIGGYLENLLDDDMLEDSVITRKFLTIMRKHAERITRIVDDMLVISRLESGEAAALKIEPFRFGSCANDVLERLESVIRERRAVVTTAISDPSITLHGDRFYWTQVLFNLVENALKQNPHAGLRVEIGCEEAQGGLDGAPDASHFRIWVMDNGVGIPSTDLPHIFRRFYRVEKHHSQQEIKGTGLGLSIVKRAVEAHHGRISVDSVPGRQTRFLIQVPT